MLAQFVHGIGFTPMFTLGTAYVDDNAPSTSTALYLGIPFKYDISLRFHTDFKQFCLNVIAIVPVNLMKATTFLGEGVTLTALYRFMTKQFMSWFFFQPIFRTDLCDNGTWGGGRIHGGRPLPQSMGGH